MYTLNYKGIKIEKILHNLHIFMLGGMNILFKKIYEEFRMINDRLSNKIDSLKNYVKKLTNQIIPTLGFSNDTDDVSFISQFLLSSKESVVEYEKVLHIDCNIKDKLVIIIYNINIINR